MMAFRFPSRKRVLFDRKNIVEEKTAFLKRPIANRASMERVRDFVLPRAGAQLARSIFRSRIIYLSTVRLLVMIGPCPASSAPHSELLATRLPSSNPSRRISGDRFGAC
jgi:hypothetical protein